jgi:hypothetical protein
MHARTPFPWNVSGAMHVLRSLSGLELLALLALVATASAFFPDLSGLPSNTTVLPLSGGNITNVPAGAFARFTALELL